MYVIVFIACVALSHQVVVMTTVALDTPTYCCSKLLSDH